MHSQVLLAVAEYHHARVASPADCRLDTSRNALLSLERLSYNEFLACQNRVDIVASPAVCEHHQVEVCIVLFVVSLEVVFRILDMTLQLRVEEHIGEDVVAV